MRLVSGVVVAAVTAGSAFLVSGMARADVPHGSLGSLTVVPATGTNTTQMNTVTSAPCPAQTKTIIQAIVGPVGTNGTAPDSATFPDGQPYAITPTTSSSNVVSTTNPITAPFFKTLADAALDDGKTIQPGEYHLVLTCADNLGIQEFGTFTGGLIFSDSTNYTVINPSPTGSPAPVTPTPAPVTPTSTPVPVTPTPAPVTPTPVVPTPIPVTPTPTPMSGTTATTTTLTVFPRSALQGVPVIFLAKVAPAGAIGSVQFADGTTPVGAPVPVFGGVALFINNTLTTGPHTMTAAFTPTNSDAFTSSTSATVSLMVQPIPGIPANGGPPPPPVSGIGGFSWIFGFLRLFLFGR
jgi:hypothetical protein